MAVLLQALCGTRSWYMELRCDSLCPFMWKCECQIWKTSLKSKIPFLCFVMAENSIFGKSSTYFGLFFSFQLPFDDEHIPTLFKKIKGWQFYSLSLSFFLWYRIYVAISFVWFGSIFLLNNYYCYFLQVVCFTSHHIFHRKPVVFSLQCSKLIQWKELQCNR